MDPRRDLARKLREVLLNDAYAVLQREQEREARDAIHARPQPAAPPLPSEPTVTEPPKPVLVAARPLITEAPSAITEAPPPLTPTPAQTPPLLARARAFLARYLAEPTPALDTLILWALHTHAYARFTVSPRLILHGRDAAADHARALRLLRWLTPAPRLVARATAANVLDLIAHESPTLLFDDAANAILARRDMRALIAAGAHADGALLGKRTRKKDGAVRRCAAPLALSTATPPPEEVLAHAIVLPMAPALERQGRAREAVADPPPEALALRTEFEAVGAEIKAANAAPVLDMPAFLGPAAAEIWSPLFVCAHALGPGAEPAARIAASQLAGADHLEPPTSARALLRDIRRIMGIDGTHLPSAHIVEALTRDPDSPWNACDYGAKLTPRALARRLACFDVRPCVIYPPNAPCYRGYKADALLTAYARYLGDPVARALVRGES
ncbi:MAG: DUF3631 domain-containing protein [Micropepsaceae bacterium]